MIHKTVGFLVLLRFFGSVMKIFESFDACCLSNQPTLMGGFWVVSEMGCKVWLL